jgi:hypothetical protein
VIKKPAAKRNTLALIAGLIWSLTGLGLATVATLWLISSPTPYLVFALALGLFVGWTVYRFKFGKLAAQNLERIYSQSPGNDKVCVFAFQNVRSYFLVLIMMTMGYLVRHSGLPKPYLAPMYLAIGVALLLSSTNYYAHLRKQS